MGTRVFMLGSVWMLALLVSGCGYAEVRESSGLAASGLYPGHVWTINDSGSRDEQVLFLLDEKGKVVAKSRIDAQNRDWEDLAAFRLGGKPYLLIADTGNNKRRRSDYLIHAIAEPTRSARRVPVAWTLRFRFPDGDHDVEAMAVDPRTHDVLLIAKERFNPIYKLPLIPPRGEVVTAERAGALAPLETSQLAGFVSHPLLAVFADRATGLDISPDGSLAAVSTYEHVYLWRRRLGEAWESAFSKPPCRIGLGGIRQYEGIAFIDGGLAVSQEGADRLHIIDAARWAMTAPDSACAVQQD